MAQRLPVTCRRHLLVATGIISDLVLVRDITMNLVMAEECKFACKVLAADLALEGLCSRVNHLMVRQVSGL